MAYGESNGHMTDDVTWPWKVELVPPMRLKPISKSAGDAIYIATIANYQNCMRWDSTVGYRSESLASCLK